MSTEDDEKYKIDLKNTFWANAVHIPLLIVCVLTIQAWNRTVMNIQGSPDLQFVATMVFVFGTMKLIIWAFPSNPHIHFKSRD